MCLQPFIVLVINTTVYLSGCCLYVLSKSNEIPLIFAHKSSHFRTVHGFWTGNLILFSINKTKSRYKLTSLYYGNNVSKWFIFIVYIQYRYHCRSSDYSYNVLYLQLTRNLWPLEAMMLTQSSKTCVEKHRPTLRQWLQIKWLVKIYLICFLKIIERSQHTKLMAAVLTSSAFKVLNGVFWSILVHFRYSMC